MEGFFAIAFFIFKFLSLLSSNNIFAFKHFSLMKLRKINTLTPTLLAPKKAIAAASLIDNA
ncbi:hypothetical protein ACQFX9_25845 [Aliinostoc sp. HNIBRCY26]|uniref:hypothetical protein n=1 Tax=Aliinostoc sp. HNIBRCY26 TaxID=3418997 RepID=UPI003CFFB092